MVTMEDISPPHNDAERAWLRQLWQAEWGGELMVSRGRVWCLAQLEAVIARVNGEPAGAATYRIDPADGCELVSINAILPGRGIGSRLLADVEARARAAGCRRVWLITSNDNLDALGFYQRRGYRIVAVYPGAIDDARRIKPGIPLRAENGIEIHDELELAKVL